MSQTLRDFSEVCWPLSVADASAKAIKDMMPAKPLRQELGDNTAIIDYGTDLGAEMRHAGIVIVFTVAAVEAALNTYVSRALLAIADPATREFVATILHRGFRAPFPAKLNLVKKGHSEIAWDAGLLQSLAELASARNALMHASLDYLVTLGPKRDAEDPFKVEDWIEYHDLQWTKQEVLNPVHALNWHAAAVKFIDLMPLALPAYKPVRFGGESQEPR